MPVKFAEAAHDIDPLNLPSLFLSMAARVSAMDSSLASSMNPQVLMRMVSASSAVSVKIDAGGFGLRHQPFGIDRIF